MMEAAAVLDDYATTAMSYHQPPPPRDRRRHLPERPVCRCCDEPIEFLYVLDKLKGIAVRIALTPLVLAPLAPLARDPAVYWLCADCVDDVAGAT